MRITLGHLFAAAASISFCVTSIPVLAGYRDDMHATSVELAQLPEFCWAQFEVPGAQGQEFTVHNCGPGANHYCPALIFLIRGKSARTKNESLGFLNRADMDVGYTERAIADYPSCSIREHVQATRTEVNHLLRVFGGKPAAR